jgi:hypothetical protein
LLVVEVGSGRQRLEHAFPHIAFTWPEGAEGDTVFVVEREEIYLALGG